MPFGPWIAGHGCNFSSVNARGGGRLDVLARLLHLFELARRHGVWVILASWEYQDSSWFVADPRVRAEVYAVPEERRFMHLAEHHDRLLGILKSRGLAESVAFVEVHNEPEYSDFPRGLEGKRFHQGAVALLRARHPDILISVERGYWGFMPGTYCGPEHLIWTEDPAWLRRVNGRFQAGVLTGSGGAAGAAWRA